MSSNRVRWSASVEIAKAEKAKQLVFGWLSVAIDADGKPVVDHEGDIIPPEELEQAAYDFVLYSRQAGEMHEKIGIGRLVESMVFTEEKIKALGIPEGTLPIGWWVGFKIDDLDVWEKIESGEYRAFSIGGTAEREEVA